MLHPAIKVAKNEVIEGKGLVTTAFIPKGTVVSRLEPNQRMYRIDYVLGLSEEQQDAYMHYCYQCDEDNIVCEDGDEKYMNHSCEPNTWWGDNQTMIARRDILAGEEITYDYCTTEIDIPFEMACHCGAATCRAVISNTDYRRADWQAFFGEHLPSHTKARIHQAALEKLSPDE